LSFKTEGGIYLDFRNPKHSNVEHAIGNKTKKIIADEIKVQTNNTEWNE
jgi:hypothetical protein